MRIVNHSSIAELMAAVNFKVAGLIDEDDIDTENNECERFGRKRRDGEILSTLAANTTGVFLDIGTSHGRSAYKFARNAPGSTVHTVNALPEQLGQSAGNLVTHSLNKDQIGRYFREKNITNIIQHYANTQEWVMPDEIDELSIAFVDGAHDKDCVYRDTINAYERLKPGGYIAWHDFSPRFRSVYPWIDEVMSAVEFFIAMEHLHDAEIHCLDYSWIGFLKKPSKKTGAQGVSVIAAGRPSPAMVDVKKLRYLVVFPEYAKSRANVENGWAGRIRNLGYTIETFPIPCPGGWLHFPELDRRYRNRDQVLMKAYEDLARRLETFDVMIASGGSMLHPDFVRQLAVYTIWTSADDPESSEVLSRPAAPAFDHAFTANPSCVDLFRSWGCKSVGWLFSPIRPQWCAPHVDEEQILTGERQIDCCFLGARGTPVEDRTIKIQELTSHFPNSVIRGSGWPGGNIWPHLVYPRAKIGWNITNNTIGPNNTRTVHLPAMGVMQICDNPSGLRRMFKLGEEVVGYDSIADCIDKTRYYLDHDRERREIAYRGWKRAMADYSEARWWENLVQPVAEHFREKMAGTASSEDALAVPGLGLADEIKPLSENVVGIARGECTANAYDRSHVEDLLQQALALYFGNDKGFSNIIAPGSRVVLKPNLVLHMNKSGAGMDCMITHPELLLATIARVSACQPSRITIADAPLQRCKWEQIVTEDLKQRIAAAAGDIPVTLLDLRRTVMPDNSLSHVITDRKAKDDYLLFDLGSESILEPITGDKNFRVTCYDPEELAKTHHRGKHQYLLWKEIFEADVVINMPKLKTHRKTGLTGALKNLVGINGNKDYLPHHRFGGSGIGGDCYPGWEWWKHCAEVYYDEANKAIGTPLHDLWLARAERLLGLFGRYHEADLEGGWYGNDTCWRMCLDLNRCLLYGDPAGNLHAKPQRQIFHLTDAIVCGQGEGPLAPYPLAVGVLTFSGSAAYSDLAHSALLHLDFKKLNLVKGSFTQTAYPLVSERQAPVFRTSDGDVDYLQLSRTYGKKAETPRGWKGFCEL